jgi:hypothetical protein
MTDESYRNAGAAIPERLMAELRKHHVGLLYVSKDGVYHAERRALIEKLLRRGVRTAQVAELAGMTQRRVQQIRKAMLDREAKRSKKISR